MVILQSNHQSTKPTAMNNNTQRKSPMFAEVNVGWLTCPNGVALTLPSDTDPEMLAGYLRIKV